MATAIPKIKRQRNYKPSLTAIAKVGLRLDDWFGDGIRIEKVRNPNAARKAALDLVYKNQLPLDESIILDEYAATAIPLIKKDRARKIPFLLKDGTLTPEDMGIDIRFWSFR